MRRVPGLPAPGSSGGLSAIIIAETVLAASKLSLPFLTLFLVQQHGFSYALAGSYLAARSLGAWLAINLAGAAADRYGERRVVLALIAGSAVCAGVMPLLGDSGALLVAFFALGALVQATQPGFSALIARTVPVNRWTEAYAAEYWAINAGFALTAAVGGLIATRSYAMLFHLEAFLSMIAFVIVFKWLPSPPAASGPDSDRAPAGGIWQRLRGGFAEISLAARDRLAMALIATTVLFSISLSQLTATLPLDMEQLGYGADQYGLAVFANGATLVLLQMPTGRLLARHDRPRILVLAAAVLASGFALLTGLHSHLVLIIGCVVIFTVGEMMDAPARGSIIGGLAGPATQARYMGLVWSGVALGFCVGPLIGGPILQSGGRTALWSFAAGCAALAAVGRAMIAGRVRRRLATEPA